MLRSGYACGLLPGHGLRFPISFWTYEHYHQSDLLYVALHFFLCVVHHELMTYFSQVEIGLAPFTAQMDAPRPVSVSSTNSTSPLRDKTHCLVRLREQQPRGIFECLL